MEIPLIKYVVKEIPESGKDYITLSFDNSMNLDFRLSSVEGKLCKFKRPQVEQLIADLQAALQKMP